MTKYACKNCRYKFDAESNMLNRLCPYCGEQEVILEKTAEDLINEVE